MIELLGIGVRDDRGGWLLHRVCTRIGSGRLVAVISTRSEERRALLDVIAGRTPVEDGRAWVAGLPVAAETIRRIRSLVGEMDPGAGGIVWNRSVRWNVLAAGGRGRIAGLLRLPRPTERRRAQAAMEACALAVQADLPASALDPGERARLALARALTREPEILVIHDLDAALGTAAPGFLECLRAVAGARRLFVLVSLGSMNLVARHADRVLVLAGGALVLDGPPEMLGSERARGRLAAMAVVP